MQESPRTQTQKITRSTTVAIIGGVALSFGVYFLLPQTSSGVVIETAPILELKPHVHNLQDSVSDPGHHSARRSSVYIAPRDMYISDISADIINAPDVVLHHLALVDIDQKNDTCSIVPFRELILFGQDTMHPKTVSFPKGYAFKIKKGTRLMVFLSAHNPTPPVGPGGDYKNVSARITLQESVESPDRLKAIKFRFFHLDQTPCGFTEPDLSDIRTFTVPPHVSNYIFSATGDNDPLASFVFSRPSTIVYMGGHVHGWQKGQELTVKRNGVPFHRFLTTPSVGVPFRYDTPHFATSTRVEAGDRISISAVYNNPHGTETRGAMGMMGLFYSEDE